MFEYLVLPIGLCNAPDTFQRLKNTIFSDLMHCLTIYLNDILVFSPSIEQHLLNLCAVFEKLRSDKLFAKHKKCFFGKTLVKNLGHIVEAGTLHADPDKVEAIRTWPKPNTTKGL